MIYFLVTIKRNNLKMARFRMSFCRGFLYLVVGLAACELLILNITILYAYFSIHNEIAGLFAGSQKGTFIDKLLQVPSVRNLVYEGKNGGFLKLIQNTVERMYFVTENGEVGTVAGANSPHASGFDRHQIGYMAMDVSSAGEALFLIRRIRGRGKSFFTKYNRLIVDIGANDGLLSSNSFNLIQLGWDAILVEPQLSLLNLAKQNIERYADPYNEGKQKVILVNSLIGQRDGLEDFVLTSEDMESHVFDARRARRESRVDTSKQLIVKVPSMTVQSFARKYKVPTNFAILSIDAEGIGDKILHQWLDAGFRPAYILYELLHNREHMAITAAFMRSNGYRFLIKLGWNYVYEHVPEDQGLDLKSLEE